jgi:hypothetical protein
VLARLLLIIPLVAIAIAAILYFTTRDRRYLKFIRETVRFTLIVAVVVFLYFAARRLGVHIG